ncbi:MAG: hypothetical protein HUU20_23405 [Pirellulales bacterium]|nr:hypothetical protein [Pirellulales bacterium]
MTIALTVLLLLIDAAADQRPDVMHNGGFEEGMGGWQPSVDDPKAVGAAVTIDPSKAREGGKSLKISLPGPSSAGIASSPAPVKSGRDYLLSFWYRSEGFSETGVYAGVNLQYVLTWLDTMGKPVGTAGAGLSYGAVPQWRFMVSMLTVPSGAAAVQIRFPMSVNESGRPSCFWLDDVRLRAWPGEPNPGGRAWRFAVSEGHYQQDLFRRVADDDTASGFAVLANPRFTKKPGYLAANLYTRVVPPGQYRAVFRLKLGEIPAAASAALGWDINTDSIGHLSAGSISTAAFQQAATYQDVAVRFVLPPGVTWIDPRLTWNGQTATWVDTVTIVEEKVFAQEDVDALMGSGAPALKSPEAVSPAAPTAVPAARAGNTYAADIEQAIARREPWPEKVAIARVDAITRELYLQTADTFFQGVRRTAAYWLKQPKPYPNMAANVENAKWLAMIYAIRGDEEDARTAAMCLEHAHRLIVEPQADTRNTQPSWLTVVDLYFIERWLASSPAYMAGHRKKAREIVLRAVPAFPEQAVEYGAFNRAFHGAITGEALLLLVPDAPDAGRWRQFKEQVWRYWWQFRDNDESTDHYNALWFRYLLDWVEMRGCSEEFWSDPGVKRLFERYLYQVFPMGAFPHYSDSCGWNVSWGHWIWLFESCAAHYRDGRYKWAAHRLYDYGVGRIEKLDSWSYTGSEAGWSLLNAYRIADDTIAERPRECDVAVLMRHKAVERSEAERVATRQFFDLKPEMAPDKLVFYGGSDRDALSMMVDVVGDAGHSHARRPAILALADHGSVLLASLGYLERLPEEHNIPLVADYDGYPCDNTPYHIKSDNNLLKEATAVDLGAAGYGRVRVDNYQGYPAALVREIVFIKHGAVVVKDTLSLELDLKLRWGPVFRARNAGPDHGEHWINTSTGPWMPLRGLGRNAPVYTRWRNSPRDLLIYFLPDPCGRLELVDESQRDPTLPLPLRVQYTLRQDSRPGASLVGVSLLVPHGPGSAGPLAQAVRVLLAEPARTVVEFPDADGARNLVVLNSTGRALELDGLKTDAQVAYVRQAAGKVAAVSLYGGKELFRGGVDLARQAPLPKTNVIPGSFTPSPGTAPNTASPDGSRR